MWQRRESTLHASPTGYRRCRQLGAVVFTFVIYGPKSGGRSGPTCARTGDKAAPCSKVNPIMTIMRSTIIAAMVGALAMLVAWPSSAADDRIGLPEEWPFGKTETIGRDWRPGDCRIWDRQGIICAIEAFIACEDFFRKELCEQVGLYPSLVPEHDYALYGQRVVEADWVQPDLRQYRLLEIGSLDPRYLPPLLLAHIETRYCWRMERRPVFCSLWWREYAVISELDSTEPNIAASGVVAQPR